MEPYKLKNWWYISILFLFFGWDKKNLVLQDNLTEEDKKYILYQGGETFYFKNSKTGDIDTCKALLENFLLVVQV